MKKWKKLSSKKIFSHPRLDLWEDEVELPSGHKTSYLHYGTSHHSAMIIAINSEGKFLVQKEYSYPTDEWLYQFPGGGINEGEDPEVGAARELAEEAQLSGDLKLIGWFYRDNRRTGGKMYVYLATNLSDASAKQDIEESFETYWFTQKEIEELINGGKFVNYAGLAGWALYLCGGTKTVNKR